MISLSCSRWVGFEEMMTLICILRISKSIRCASESDEDVDFGTFFKNSVYLFCRWPLLMTYDVRVVVYEYICIYHDWHRFSWLKTSILLHICSFFDKHTHIKPFQYIHNSKYIVHDRLYMCVYIYRR